MKIPQELTLQMEGLRTLGHRFPSPPFSPVLEDPGDKGTWIWDGGALEWQLG